MTEQGATDAEIVEAVQKLVADRISAGTFVILVGDAARNYYIQFALQGDRLFCEAVDNQYLEPADQLTDAQLRTLENLGWREPEHEAQNWFRTFRPVGEDDYVEIAALVRRAFSEVYGLATDTPLGMRRSWDGQLVAPVSQIHFASEGHRSTYEKVVRFAVDMYDQAVEFDARRPVFFVQQGSTIVSVAVNHDIHSSVIDLYCLIARELDSTPELMSSLLHTNYTLQMGALALDGDGDVVLRHSIIGDTATQEEFQLVMGVFTEAADQLDDEITSLFGGYTARGWAHR